MQHSCLNEESDRLKFGAQKVPQFLKTGVVVWGAGGHAKVVLDVLRLRHCDVLGLVDDTTAGRTTTSFCGFPVYHDLDEVPVAKKQTFLLRSATMLHVMRKAAMRKTGASGWYRFSILRRLSHRMCNWNPEPWLQPARLSIQALSLAKTSS